jgi:hypothetical protein
MIADNTLYRQTYTQEAARTDDFVLEIEKELLIQYEWVELSNSMPVVLNGRLHYTVTVTAGNYI